MQLKVHKVELVLDIMSRKCAVPSSNDSFAIITISRMTYQRLIQPFESHTSSSILPILF